MKPLRLHAKPASRAAGVAFVVFGVVFAAAGGSTYGESGPDGGLGTTLVMAVFGAVMIVLGLRLVGAAVRVDAAGVTYRRFAAQVHVPANDVEQVEVQQNDGAFSSQEVLVLVTKAQRVPLTLLAAYKTPRGRAWLNAQRQALQEALGGER